MIPTVNYVLTREDDGTFSAWSNEPHVGIFTQGDTMEELLRNLQEAASLHLEVATVVLQLADSED